MNDPEASYPAPIPIQRIDHGDHPAQVLLTSPGEGGLTLAEAATQLGISDKTIRRWIRAGKLLANQVEGPHGLEYRIAPLDLARPVATPPAPGELSLSLDAFVERITAAIIAANATRDAQMLDALRQLYQVIGELEDELTHARRPWWQRLFGNHEKGAS